MKNTHAWLNKAIQCILGDMGYWQPMSHYLNGMYSEHEVVIYPVFNSNNKRTIIRPRYSVVSSIDICIKLLIICFILSGCSIHPRFKIEDVDSPQSAFIKLTERSQSLKSFRTDAEFFLTAPKGKLRLKGEIDYSTLYGWHVELNGPLGIKLVDIESIKDGFQINLPHSGTTLEINDDEPVDLPELEARFSNLSFVTTLLLPVLPFNNGTDWIFAGGEIGESGSLFLINSKDDTNDSLAVSLDYNTLKMETEELWHNGVKSYKRTFEYDSDNDYFPKGIRINMDELELYIKYGDVKIDFDISRTRIL